MAYNREISQYVTQRTWMVAVYQMAKIYSDCNEGMKTNLRQSDIYCQVNVDTSRIGSGLTSCYYASLTRNYIDIQIPHEEAFGSFPDYTEDTCRRYNEILWDNFRACGGFVQLFSELKERIHERNQYLSRRLSIY